MQSRIASTLLSFYATSCSFLKLDALTTDARLGQNSYYEQLKGGRTYLGRFGSIVLCSCIHDEAKQHSGMNTRQRPLPSGWKSSKGWDQEKTQPLTVPLRGLVTQTRTTSWELCQFKCNIVEVGMALLEKCVTGRGGGEIEVSYAQDITQYFSQLPVAF